MNTKGLESLGLESCGKGPEARGPLKSHSIGMCVGAIMGLTLKLTLVSRELSPSALWKETGVEDTSSSGCCRVVDMTNFGVLVTGLMGR